ncbi:MAG TPA: Gfo/Idh/MocA family oxidoreductase [Bryobacteraceae bacterium]
MADSKSVRYAVVGLGWIAQEVVLPAFEHSAHSELAALVTGDAEKARELGEAYKIPRTYSYEEFDRVLVSEEVDAIYISLPNSMHAEYAIRAAQAGIHVLCEKPMAASIGECKEMIRAAEDAGTLLMIAYRLHFEPANLKAIELVGSGEIGQPRTFVSSFSQNVKPGDIRLKEDLAGGPLMDMSIYQINAARYLFREEPTEVMAFATRPTGDDRFREVYESISALLRFPGDQIAAFTTSFGGAASDEWQLVGTRGTVNLKHAFEYHEEKEMTITIEGKEKKESFPKLDQFGAEIQYFSECILEGKNPEPSGQEGLADIRVIEGLLKSIEENKPVSLVPYEVGARPSGEQEMKLPPVKSKKIVHAAAPTGS